MSRVSLTVNCGAYVSATCGWCDKVHNYELTEPVSGSVENIAEELQEAADGELEEQGWSGGYCPECCAKHAKSIADDARADEDDGGDER